MVIELPLYLLLTFPASKTCIYSG